MEISVLPLAFSPVTVASRLLHPYSTDDKTSRLMVKQFSTARDTREIHRVRGDKREEGDMGDQQEKREESKGERAI